MSKKNKFGQVAEALSNLPQADLDLLLEAAREFEPHYKVLNKPKTRRFNRICKAIDFIIDRGYVRNKHDIAIDTVNKSIDVAWAPKVNNVVACINYKPAAVFKPVEPPVLPVVTAMTADDYAKLNAAHDKATEQAAKQQQKRDAKTAKYAEKAALKMAAKMKRDEPEPAHNSKEKRKYTKRNSGNDKHLAPSII